MTPFTTMPTRLGAILLPLALSIGPAHAALLLQQPPTLAADAVRVGSEGQGGLLAESFSFSGTGQVLAWWGTEASDFVVDLYDQGASPALLFSTSAVTASATSWTVSIAGVDLPVHRFSIDLAALAGGSYTVAVRETALDALGGTWYWLLGSGGDGQHLSGFLEPFQITDDGGDLSLELLGDPSQPVPLPPTAALLLAALGALALRRRTAAG